MELCAECRTFTHTANCPKYQYKEEDIKELLVCSINGKLLEFRHDIPYLPLYIPVRLAESLMEIFDFVEKPKINF